MPVAHARQGARRLGGDAGRYASGIPRRVQARGHQRPAVVGQGSPRERGLPALAFWHRHGGRALSPRVFVRHAGCARRFPRAGCTLGRAHAAPSHRGLAQCFCASRCRGRRRDLRPVQRHQELLLGPDERQQAALQALPGSLLRREDDCLAAGSRCTHEVVHSPRPSHNPQWLGESRSVLLPRRAGRRQERADGSTWNGLSQDREAS